MSIGRVPGVTGIQPSIVDAKGDLIVATAADSVDRLAVGSANQVLTVDSSTATGLKWATPAAGGKVLQVVQGTITTQQSTTSGSFVDTGLTASITPSSTSSKIYIAVSFMGEVIKTGSSTTNYGVYNLVRSSTQLQRHAFGNVNYASASNNDFFGPISFSYLDSPSTVSSTTYKVQFRIDSCTTIYMNNTNGTEIASIVLMEIGA